jgi:nucleoside permease NupC
MLVPGAEHSTAADLPLRSEAGGAMTAGSLMGIKTILNEFLACIELARLPAGALSDRSLLIMIYALCGFANFGNLGIMLGGSGRWSRNADTRLPGWDSNRYWRAPWRR